MPLYDHLQLVRLPERLERRKRPGRGSIVPRDAPLHVARLRESLNNVTAQQTRRRPAAIDPSLILRVRMTGALREKDWEDCGLTILSTDADRTLVLFSSDEELREFRQRLEAFAGPIPARQRYPRFAGFVGAIEEVNEVEPRDRIGRRLREAGIGQPNDFLDGDSYTVDVELWDVGRREVRENRLGAIEGLVAAAGGEVLDRYIGTSITMIRVTAGGMLIRRLLEIADVAVVDAPPQPDTETAELLDQDLADVPPVEVLPDNAPVIGIVDTGINDHPLLNGLLVGAIGIPNAIGTADTVGHGTRVGGIAAFGDLRTQLPTGQLRPSARLCSARVLNDGRKFDDRRLVPTLMREAIARLHQDYGARLFVIALADDRSVYDGGKVGTWAATLDELARDLDIVIFVAAGNRTPRGGAQLDAAVTEYPTYLLEPTNRLFEPGGAINVVTVGSLAHGEGIDGRLAEHAHVRPITRALEPSPFTRIGPGAQGATKPDFVDLGGTMILDPMVRRLQKGDTVPSAGVITLHHEPLNRLLTSGSGTSYAAPNVAYKAALVLTRFPTASANLVRALLTSAAAIPDEARDRLQLLGTGAIQNVCGFGVVNTAHAIFSDDARVLLYAEDELALDHFAVYELPIPQLFQATAGRRSIRITLAFDPPVRHTRADYAGVRMNFRLVRGCTADQIFEHFRRRTEEDGPVPEMANRFDCKLLPGPQQRDGSTLQSAQATFQRDVSNYGDRYHLVIRCERGWVDERIATQGFAVVAEIAHENPIQLYAQIQQRVRIRA